MTNPQQDDPVQQGEVKRVRPGKTRTYRSWAGMKHRCSNPNLPEYKHYGGRGISVCERWKGKDGFKNFLEDMGERPENTSIDRINNDGNYEPSNCRWATPRQQRANQREGKLNYAGKKGVHYVKLRDTWGADIWIEGMFFHLGTYGTRETASAVRVAAEKIAKQVPELITREAVRLCNAVIGSGCMCDLVSEVCMCNRIYEVQKQRLADLVKGEGGDE